MVVVVDDQKKEELIQCRNQLFNELLKHIRNSSNESNEELYKYIVGTIKQIDFINEILDSNNKNKSIQKKLERRKILNGILSNTK